ncbi:MAG: hypothetical protein ACYTGC_20800, partial [Planctomycetota bacterium]
MGPRPLLRRVHIGHEGLEEKKKMSRPINPCRHWLLALTTVLAGACLLGPTPASAGEPHRSLRAIPTPPAQGGIAGPGSYATGFEPGEGFTLGFIGGNGVPPWGAFAASSVQPQVDNLNPASGTQHLRLSKDPGVSNNAFIGCFSPPLGAVTPGPATFSVEVSISATGGAAYDIVLQAPTQAMLAARVRFDPFGNLLVFDNPGTFPQFVDSGTNWPLGQYFTMSICLDPDTDSLEYYIDGELAYTSLAGVIGANAIEQVIIASNNNQVTDHADF